MDILTSKQKRTDYEALSRYAPFSFYYHTLDDKFVYGLTGHILDNAEYVAHTVLPSDTLDSLALKYYGRPDYFWIIADFNRIKDPLIPLLNFLTVIKVPNLGQITFEVR
jgi:hypothetical protein